MSLKSRQCGECTLCCEGTLSANIFGEEIYYGSKPCMFLNKLGVKGCSIYEMNRPKVCSEYRCVWLQGYLPDEYRPDKINMIVHFVIEDDIHYKIIPRPGTKDPVMREKIKKIMTDTYEQHKRVLKR